MAYAALLFLSIFDVAGSSGQEFFSKSSFRHETTYAFSIDSYVYISSSDYGSISRSLLAVGPVLDLEFLALNLLQFSYGTGEQTKQ